MKLMANETVKVSKLSDVARLAGVGNATVSRALNGGKNVSEDKMARIRAAIQKLNYRPNRAARSLKGAPSGLIGMIVPSISDVFFSQCAEAVESVARQHKALVVVIACDDDEVLIADLRELLVHSIDGLVLACARPHSKAFVAALRRVLVPVVGIDGPLEDAGKPSVVCANYDGARMATEHLIWHGYRRIISVQVNPTMYTMRERLRGYKAAMAAAGLEPVQEIITDRAGALRVLKKHVRPKAPVSIFTGNNLTARFISEAVHELRLSIPEQVSLLSFDDFYLADALTPAMSVVQQPIEEMGRTAARLLFQQLQGAAPGETGPGTETLMLQPRLVLRASCGCKHG